MLAKIWKIIMWAFGLIFGNKPGPGPVSGKKVTNVWIQYDDKGKPIKKKVRYDDGATGAVADCRIRPGHVRRA